MEEVRKFKDFSEKQIPANADYIVGYESASMKEIRVPVSSLTSRGTNGSSVQIQYSSDGSSWHYPSQSGDIYMRQKIGTDPWSQTFRIAIKEIREISVLFTKKSMNGEISPVPFKWINDLQIQEVVMMSNATSFTATINGKEHNPENMGGVKINAGTEFRITEMNITAGNTQGNVLVIFKEA
ncbi:MAG: hypothetical protein LBQ22_01855 [Bacteroidales bacterium]|jgi:hypothetical protein|nr:hypothetical protein [Bacteroidales bacterium]